MAACRAYYFLRGTLGRGELTVFGPRGYPRHPSEDQGLDQAKEGPGSGGHRSPGPNGPTRFGLGGNERARWGRRVTTPKKPSIGADSTRGRQFNGAPCVVAKEGPVVGENRSRGQGPRAIHRTHAHGRRYAFHVLSIHPGSARDSRSVARLGDDATLLLNKQVTRSATGGTPLGNLGISRDQSSDWQRVASISGLCARRKGVRVVTCFCWAFAKV